MVLDELGSVWVGGERFVVVEWTGRIVAVRGVCVCLVWLCAGARTRGRMVEGSKAKSTAHC